ncbi:MAG: cyclase family protein [Alphaproteobacteria bacterium]|nr:cyclase family protein [Alphaproteobacteria bacterium]
MFSSFQLVDLSQEIHPLVPTWTGSCGFKSEIKMDYDEGLRVQKLHLHAGLSTHMDAPSHFFQNKETLSDLDLKNFIVPIYVIKKKIETLNTFIEAEDVLKFLEEHEEPEENSFIAFHTGWDKKFSDPEAYRANLQFPGVCVEAIDLLMEYHPVGIGIDTLSPDGSNPHHPIHHLVLSKGLYIIENLNQLDLLPVKGAFLIGLPLKIKGGTEGPIRAVAFF